jgi:spermidine synthase
MILWSKYFDESTSIVGVDIQFEQLAHAALKQHSRATLLKGNSTQMEFVNTLGKYDIIIDDGSHEVDDQIKTFNNLSDRLNDGGIYIIEDINGAAIDKIKSAIPSGQVLDLRTNKGRWDDVMLIYRKDDR